MIEGQLFFRDALRTGPLGEKISRILAPADEGLDRSSMERHCRRFVKTDYHPCSTAPMGADHDAMAVLDARMAVRGITGLKVGDMSAPPNLIAGNTNALAMVLGRRCAAFVLHGPAKLSQTEAAKRATP
jgi:choline dehydrogenase-like flavoprotein